MSLEHIRDTYGVPAQLGARIRFSGGGRHDDREGTQEGTIVGAQGAYILVRFDGELFGDVALHPTWRVTYLGQAAQGASPPAEDPQNQQSQCNQLGGES